MHEQGTISVHTEHIFPIIKRFLYADQDVFLRELVVNGVDAIQKLKKLGTIGLYEGVLDGLQVEVVVDRAQKTLTIRDNGLGMTVEEVKQYINQIAFSGATAFVEQYKDQLEQHQLIGCFGLGFYSAFMVAKQVEIITKSYQLDAQAVQWSCDGSTNFTIDFVDKAQVGTDVVLHLSEDSEEFLEQERIQSILSKHCRFLPVSIVFDGKVVNDVEPIWIKNPVHLTAQDYLAFYKVLYPFAEDPLFWIHLNMDYPFILTGVLYFPKVAHYFEQKETIQLYAKQVFITNDVREVIPDFLRLLHGVIDSPDIPLNVSRSSLQADKSVKKINNYISKKVAEKLEMLFEQDRKAYEAKWNDIALFIKYGMITDEKFDERVRAVVLLENIMGDYYTIAEYRDKVSKNQVDKHGNEIFLYATDMKKQAVYLQSAQQKGYDILLLNSPIDTNFINFSEHKLDKVKFKGVDTDTLGNLIEQEEAIMHLLSESERETLQSIYEKIIGTVQTSWRVVAMLSEELPVTLLTSELLKRMEHLTQIQKRDGPQEHLRSMQLAINSNHPLAKKILDTVDPIIQKQLVEATYHLALLAQGLLQGELLATFIKSYTDGLLKQ